MTSDPPAKFAHDQDAAIAQLAAMLRSARAPLFAGLGTDMAGCRAALALAAKVGGTLDHMHGAALGRYTAALRSGRMYFTTPREALARADCVLLVGAAAQGMAEGFAAAPRLGLAAGSPRRVMTLGTGADLLGDLLALSAALHERGAPPAGVELAALREARFGVIAWSPEEMGETAIAAIMECAETLSAATRWTTLPLLPGDNAIGFLHSCGWHFGASPPLAMRAAAARPSFTGATQALAAGEADILVWISGFRALPPPPARCPVVALMPGPAPGGVLAIPVGVPGLDHDAEFHDTKADTIRFVAATRATSAPTVAAVLDAVRASIRSAA